MRAAVQSQRGGDIEFIALFTKERYDTLNFGFQKSQPAKAAT
jgi:hypothetical protein